MTALFHPPLCILAGLGTGNLIRSGLTSGRNGLSSTRTPRGGDIGLGAFLARLAADYQRDGADYSFF